MTIEVQVRGNNVEKAMRVLKKKLLKDGLMRELKERQHYSKPSAVKREAKKQQIRRFKKASPSFCTIRCERLYAGYDGYHLKPRP